MPTATARPVRKRRPFSRSTRGCKTCRIRHVKCDETRPSCKGCTSTGRACDGYTSSDAWEIITPVSAIQNLALLPQASKFDDRANASFHYFRAHTITYISGLFGRECEHVLLRAGALDEAVHYAILAIGNVHKDLERGCGPGISATADEWATKQYLKSMRSLTASKNKDLSTNTDVVLATCVLYTCFEALRRNHGAVMNHIQGGLKIVNEYRDRVYHGSKQTLIPSKHLIQAFARLERQLCELQRYTGPKLALELTQRTASIDRHEYCTPRPSPIICFSTFHEAWEALDRGWHAMHAWLAKLQHLSPEDSSFTGVFSHRETLHTDFSDWKVALDELRRSRYAKPTRREKCISALLDCHFILAKQCLEVAKQTGEMFWDQRVHDFEQVIDLCYSVVAAEIDGSTLPLRTGSMSTNSVASPDGASAQVRSTILDLGQSPESEASACLQSDSSDSINLTPREIGVSVTVGQRYIPEESPYDGKEEDEALLSFDMGIMPVIFHVLSKCRDARIRLRTINLLEHHPRLEGIWDGLLLAKVARRLDAIERQSSLEEAAARGALPDEIPSWTRIAGIDVTFGAVKREAFLMFSKLEDDPRMDPERIEDVVTW